MSPRTAVIVGSIICLGAGAAMIAYFGSILYHWHATGDVWLQPMRSPTPAHYARYSDDGFNVAFTLGLDWLGFTLGVFAVFGGLGCVFLLMKSVFRFIQRAD